MNLQQRKTKSLEAEVKRREKRVVELRNKYHKMSSLVRRLSANKSNPNLTAIKTFAMWANNASKGLDIHLRKIDRLECELGVR